MGSTRLPEVDLRAMALSAAAATPLYAWFVFDPISFDFEEKPAVRVAVDHIQLIIGAFITSFGYVFVALGGAFALQRGAAFRTFVFKVRSLVIVCVLSALYVIANVPDLFSPDYDYMNDEIRSRLLASLVLNAATPIAIVMVAAHFYINWQRHPPEEKDGARFGTIAAAGLMLATSTLVYSAAAALHLQWKISMISPGVSAIPSITVLPLLQSVTASVVDTMGIVFLFTSIAIACLRRARAEDSLGWVTVAMLAAAIGYWIVDYGLPYASALLSLPPGSAPLDQPIELAICGAIGLAAGPFYLYAVNRDALRKAIADLPRNVEALRRWPDRGSD